MNSFRDIPLRSGNGSIPISQLVN